MTGDSSMPAPAHRAGWRPALARAVGATAILLIGVPGRLFPQAHDSTARLERVADSTYVIIHQDATDEWPHGNTGVILTAEGVFVVDADYLPSRAEADIALIRSLTDRPVRYVAYTHWHFDHNNGGSAYQEAFPGVTIVSERETRGWIALNSRYWAALSTAPNSARRQALAALEREASTGRDSTGRTLDPADRAKRRRAVQQRAAELAELASLRVVPPNLTFEGTLSLWLGGRRIDLRDRGRANSPHDVTVYLPRDSVLFTGDIVVQSPLPFVGASWPVPWIAVLRQLEAEPVRTIVPGHGPVMRDWSYPHRVRGLLEAATSRAEAMALRGRPLAEVQDSVTLADHRAATPAWQGAALDADWRETVRILVERAWRGVRGQG
jgi:glyoxylase-like metal-dependent hydrolase (beta-lactamase superfamily II)